MGPDVEDSSTDITIPRSLTLAVALAVGCLLLGVLTSGHTFESVDRSISPTNLVKRVVADYEVWQVLTIINTAFCSWAGIASIAFISLLVGIKRSEVRFSANTLTAIAVIMAGLSTVIPRAFGRISPDQYGNSYPNMFIASTVAFYGSMVILSSRFGNQGLDRAIAIVSGCILCASIFWALFFGYSWASDVIGGLLLGSALVSGVIWYLEFQKERCLAGTKQ